MEEDYVRELLSKVLEDMKNSPNELEAIIGREVSAHFERVVKGIAKALTMHPGDYREGKATIAIKTEDGLLKLRFKDLNREVKKKAKEDKKDKLPKELAEYYPYWVLEEWAIAEREGWSYKFTIDLTKKPRMIITTTHHERTQEVYAL